MKLRLLNRVALTLFVLTTAMACDGSQSADSSKDQNGKDTVDSTPACNDLDRGGTIDSKKLRVTWELPNGQLASPKQVNPFNTSTISDLDALTFHDGFNCSRMYDSMKAIGDAAYAGENPMDLNTPTFTRSLKIDGSPIVLKPTKYLGIDVLYDVYKRVQVVCQANRKHQTVERLQRVSQGLPLSCAYPTAYAVETATLPLSSAIPLGNFKPQCAKQNLVWAELCDDEFANYGGLLVDRIDTMPGHQEVHSILAWKTKPIDLKAMETQIRSALKMSNARAIEIRALANGIQADDVHAVKAIGFSSSGKLSGIRYWGLVDTHPDSSGVAAAQSLAHASVSFAAPGSLTGDSMISFYTDLSHQFVTSGILTNWNPKTMQEDFMVPNMPANRAVDASFHDAMTEAFAKHQAVSVFLVWTTTDGSVAVLTRAEVTEDGQVTVPESTVIHQFSSVGLPDQLLTR